MQDALQHRGPDGAGEFNAPHISLSVRRLSIIDLTNGWQPLYNEDRSLVLIANGEIYNFVELRAELMARGHTFQTQSDCETILHLYEEHGIECVQHLRGMFAFALWDSRLQRLLLARDRMGEKPLYYYHQEGLILFASELKALLRSGLVPFELDPYSIDLYFHFQYVPEPRTPLKGVQKLPAAHVMTVDTATWKIDRHCYWRLEDAPPLEGNAKELIRQELETIANIVIRSDVPVGIALSGGIDSGSIAALASKAYPGTLHAFSVGYPGYPAFDERQDAKRLAESLGVPFHDIEISTSHMVDFFRELTFWRDDPIADISGHGYYAVMKLAREHQVPVMLQGQGGDELFWGYPWVIRAVNESLMKEEMLQKGIGAVGQYLQLKGPPSWTLWGVRKWITSMAGLLPGYKHYRQHKNSPPDRLIFYDLTPDFQQGLRSAKNLYASNFVEALNGNSPYDPFTLPQPWSSLDVVITRLIQNTYLLENGVAQADRLSMASSVEVRLPLLDHRLGEIVIGLRKNYPDYKLPPKTWLKQAIDGLLPEWMMQKPKRGFEPPVREWHRALFEKYGADLKDGYLVGAGVLKPESADGLSAGDYPPETVAPLSFKALVLETWCREMSRCVT